jgi:CDP-glycerol glycerophosphotransferase (TagB/SpsB family)
MKRAAKHMIKRDDEMFSIVYAPTHIYETNEPFASLRTHGASIVRALLETGARVIFRPHPVSWRDEDADLVQDVINEHRSNDRFSVDKDPDYLPAYGASDLLVTDVSGTGFSYAFTFGRPAIFFARDADAERGLIGIQYQCRERIGAVVRTISQLVSSIDEMKLARAEKKREIEEFRNETVFHLGQSGQYIARQLLTIAEGGKSDEWVEL